MATTSTLFDVSAVTRPSLVLIAGRTACDEMHRAVELTGAHVSDRLDWHDVDGDLPLCARSPIFVLQATGIAPDVLADALPRVGVVAGDLEAAVILSVDAARIDIAAATMLGPRTQILCEPSMDDCVSSLIVAMEMMGRPRGPSDVAREGEAARLRQLNEEVARIADVLARLSRRTNMDPVSPSTAAAEQRLTFGSEPIAELTIDPADVRRAIRARRMRDQFFGAGLFEEPGWDMILDLYAAELERSRVSVSSLCIAAAVAPTTALRWISKLSDAGLFERHPDPFDRRRAYMELSERASQAMRSYIGGLRRAGLSLG